jgi:hypothetical protein
MAPSIEPYDGGRVRAMSSSTEHLPGTRTGSATARKRARIVRGVARCGPSTSRAGSKRHASRRHRKRRELRELVLVQVRTDGLRLSRRTPTETRGVEDMSASDRIAQIKATAHSVQLVDVGLWHTSVGQPLSPADGVVISPVDLLWLLERAGRVGGDR